MYAMVGEVRLDPARRDDAEKLLNEMVVPAAKQAPGFVAGWWTRSDDGTTGRSMIIFETEEAARQMAEMAGSPPPDSPVTPVRMEVLRVLAHA